jgi:adenylate cyclase
VLRLSIFGTFRVTDASGNEIPVKSRKSRALLAYLALPLGKPRSREQIMALLWSDRGDQQARSSLRQALSGLRKDLGEERLSALRITDEALTLDPAHVVLEPASPGEVLLDGLHLTDPAFEEWLRDERFRQEDAGRAMGGDQSPDRSGKPSIAVLPFVNMSDDPKQEYFSDGITEDIITELSRFREFDIIGRNSSFYFKGRSLKAKDVALELGARYVLEGSARKAANRVRVTSQLVDAETGAQIWADRYDGNLDDIFAIQDDVTSTVVARVADRLKVAVAEQSRSRPRLSVTAYDLVLQSRPYRTQFTPASNREAARLLREAIALDANCGQAFAGLAFVLVEEYDEGWATDPDTTLQEAISSAKRAVAIDDSDGYAHASLAYVLQLTRDFDQAAHEANTALALNPNHANIIMTCGWISIVLGDPETAIKHILRARQLNPYMPGFDLCTLGSAYFNARRYQDAIDVISQVTDSPSFSYLELAICHAYLGHEESSRSSLDQYLQRAKSEMVHFPGDDPIAWRAHFEQTVTRRRNEDLEHYIEGVRRAGLLIS